MKDGDRVRYASSKYPDLLNDVVNALDPKLGSAEYKPSVDSLCKKLCSSTRTDQKFESQPQRQTPRYLRILATPDVQKGGMFKADPKGDVGVLRWEYVKQLFKNVMWDSSPSVA